MHKELSEKYNSMKKNIETIERTAQKKKKNTISDIENTSEGINVGWMKQRIKSAI